jgi:hypothetical protein
MSRSYVPMLAMRGPVHIILRVVGGLAAMVSLMLFVLAASPFAVSATERVSLILPGTIGAVIWYAAFWARMRYDREILKRAPKDETVGLYS